MAASIRRGLWLLALAAFAGMAPAQEAPREFRNPVYGGDFPDPFALKHGGQYYAYATQTRGTGFQLMVSPDLVRWERRPLDFPIPWSRSHLWAPEVLEREGRFYLTYSALDPETRRHHIAIATADHPAGPFTHRAILVRGDDNEVGVIDATIVVEAGEATLVYSEETPRRIVARKMKPDLMAVEGPAVELLRPDLDWESGVVEAPTILRRNGVYHLLYSGGPFQGDKAGAQYAVGHASAPSLLGPYRKTPEPILRSAEGRVYGPGHQSLIDAPDGSSWVLYHAWDARGEPRYGGNPSGRTLRLDPLTWDGDTPRIAGPSTDPRPAPK